MNGNHTLSNVSDAVTSNGTRNQMDGSKQSSRFWESRTARSIPDPTRMFSLLVITIMILRYAQRHDWDFKIAMTSGFFLNPYVVSFFCMASFSVYYGYSTKPVSASPLPLYDKWVVEWYWWNSWLFHMTMDGVSGSLRLVPVVVQQYDMLDLRFPNRHVVPWIIGMIELVIMGPLCMITAASILKRHPARFALELITSTLHITGMVVFVVAELYEGQLCIPALDPVGVPGNMWANMKFDMYHFVYYWFGFWFCNLIWGFVPLLRIRRALFECSRAFQLSTITTTVEGGLKGQKIN
jgi:EXPERA (EXPanded EBP superfamily)